MRYFEETVSQLNKKGLEYAAEEGRFATMGRYAVCCILLVAGALFAFSGQAVIYVCFVGPVCSS